MPCVTIGHQSPSFSGVVVVTINAQVPAACAVNSIVGSTFFLVVHTQ